MVSVRKQKKAKPKMFLFFLLLAVVFWVLTKFSDKYTETVEANIVYENPPGDTMLATSNLDRLSFDVAGNGFEILMYRFKDPTITIDVGQYFIENSNLAVVPSAELARLIGNQLDRDKPVENISVDDLEVALRSIARKKVPVRHATSFQYKEGFRATDAGITKPDSVEISGPVEVVDQLSYLNTGEFVLSDIDSDVEMLISVEYPEDLGLKVVPEEVTLSLSVAEFTQKSVTVPVEVLNFNSEGTLRLIPESITLTFDISVEEFNNVLANDFQVSCNYETRNLEGNFMAPEVTLAPDHVQNIELSVAKIDYLIFK